VHVRGLLVFLSIVCIVDDFKNIITGRPLFCPGKPRIPLKVNVDLLRSLVMLELEYITAHLANEIMFIVEECLNCSL